MSLSHSTGSASPGVPEIVTKLHKLTTLHAQFHHKIPEPCSTVLPFDCKQKTKMLDIDLLY